MSSMDYKHLLNVEVCLITNRRKKAFEDSVNEQNNLLRFLIEIKMLSLTDPVVELISVSVFCIDS